jgi:hypothetical protein
MPSNPWMSTSIEKSISFDNNSQYAEKTKELPDLNYRESSL